MSLLIHVWPLSNPGRNLRSAGGLIITSSKLTYSPVSVRFVYISVLTGGENVPVSTVEAERIYQHLFTRGQLRRDAAGCTNTYLNFNVFAKPWTACV